ncbi:MAG TPA: hypothetical protein VFP55_08525 [Solirubrobacteraceae bacterium]|nr:hypothetical protein [Solirubrobacteraceae bacterium]
MSRKVFDKITSGIGIVLVAVLLVAGGLMTWGHSYATSSVRNQLAPQQIYFPAKAAFKNAKAGTEVTPQMIPYLEKYAGQQVLTGAQAAAYADHFIAYHLAAMPYKGVYSKVSAAAMAAKPGSPAYTQLSELKTTVFQGTTLRGLLLEAYGFSKIGSIMMVGAIASFILAAITAILVGLGFWHAARTAEEETLFSQRARRAGGTAPTAA